MIITEDNEVIIFHTKKFEIFEKEMSTADIGIISQKFPEHLEVKYLQNVGKKSDDNVWN